MNNKHFRNALHTVIGFAIGYNFTSITDFHKYSWYNQIVGVFAVTLIVSIVAYFWEWLQLHFVESNPDFADVIRTAIGGLLGSIICLGYGVNDNAFAILTVFSVGVVGLEIIRVYLRIKK